MLEAAVVFNPETLVRWHRSGFRLYWRWKSRRIIEFIDDLNRDPVIHRWRYQIDAAA